MVSQKRSIQQRIISKKEICVADQRQIKLTVIEYLYVSNLSKKVLRNYYNQQFICSKAIHNLTNIVILFLLHYNPTSNISFTEVNSQFILYKYKSDFIVTARTLSMSTAHNPVIWYIY